MTETLPTTPASVAPRPPWLDRLLERGWEFEFFQAAWLLERYCRRPVAVGDRGPVAGEPLRFRPAVSMGFPATDLWRVRPVPSGEGGSLFRLDVTFMGLYGVATPLPLHYAVNVLRSVDETEQPADAAGEAPPLAEAGPARPAPDSSPVRDFLDVFHHRLISLFYRSWTKYRYHVTFGMPQRDRVSDYLLWLIGCAPGWDGALLGVPPMRLLRYAGTLTGHPKSAAALEGLLTDYWKTIPVRIEPFIGRWMTLRAADLNRIGQANSQMGADLTVGEQVYDVSSAFCITFGPVDWATYESFLPDGTGYAQTRALVRLYCTDPLAFGVEVRIRAGEIPETRLSSVGPANRLGYTSWVRTDPMPETAVTFEAN